jgi:hypothetical protein
MALETARMRHKTIMKSNRTGLLAAPLMAMILGAGCAPGSPEEQHRTAAEAGAAPQASAGQAGREGAAWLLQGDTDERFARAAKHLRGFDMAMVETGYRYTELHWAGRDANWDYAMYQLEKIRTAVENGVERRPRRAASAKMLDAGLIGVEEAIKARDSSAFSKSFEALTTICNACHKAERVSFITVAIPTERQSPVRPSPADGSVDAAAPRGGE